MDMWPENGSPRDFIDDPDMQDGFKWTCCNQAGDAEGCIVTRHVSKSSAGARNVGRRSRSDHMSVVRSDCNRITMG